MDVYCPICHEPYDVATFADYAEEADVSVDFVRKQFMAKGCDKAFPLWGPNSNCVRDESRPNLDAAIEACNEACGDDLDGQASLLDDFGFVGMFE